MNAFTRGINTAGTQVPARTHNGALTNSTSNDPIVDFFFVAGASRTMSENDIVSMFARAYGANREIALRTALWTRDARGGAGERQTFRRILRWIENNHNDDLVAILPRIPELGRWDDLLVLQSRLGLTIAVDMIRQALLVDRNGLCAKWMPRKGERAAWLRSALGMSPKQYRKTLVTLTNVVETPMCANTWEAINLEHVPSVASARYRKAFKKHLPERFVTYAQKVEKGEAKVNAGAIFPYDVIKPLSNRYGRPSQAEIQVANGQWEALPDFVGEGSFLPVVDVSGSMMSEVSKGTRALDISVSLGLYLSQRNKSAFKDVMMTFSESPQLQRVTGTLMQRIDQTISMHWGMSTNLQAAIKKILNHAVTYNVPAADMPQSLLIISDMEFNACMSGTNYQSMKAEYARHGYEMPNVVFWNVNGRVGNNPVTTKDDGTALVSGFSPSIVKNVLSAKRMNPLEIVLNTVMADRYALAA